MINIKKIHHIGISVENLNLSLRFWNEILGLQIRKMEEVPSHQVKVAFLSTGDSDIELVTKLNCDIPGNLNIKSSTIGLDHLCLEVEDLEKVLAYLMKNGIKLKDNKPVKLPGRKVAFVDPSEADGVLLEFYELT